MKKKNKKILPPEFSSYQGRVHIQGITTKPAVFRRNKNVYMNSVCAGHVIVDESEMFSQNPLENK